MEDNGDGGDYLVASLADQRSQLAGVDHCNKKDRQCRGDTTRKAGLVR
jgi:hypothetical protein